MKLLYEFELSEEQDIEVPVESKNEAGEKTVTMKTEKKTVTARYGIKKPNRSLREAAQIFNAVEINDLIKLGVLTHAQLQRRLEDDGGTISNNQNQALNNISGELVKVSNEIAELKKQLDEKKDEKTQEAYDLKIKDLDRIKNQIANFYVNQMSLYQNTAEVIARNKTLAYYICFLSAKQDKGQWVEMFSSPDTSKASFESRADQSDELFENANELDKKALSKLSNLIGTWFASGLNTTAEWEKADKMYEAEIKARQ